MASDPRFRVVLCPRGTAAVVSDREPGPVIGERGSLSGWQTWGDWTDWRTATDAAYVVNSNRAGDLLPRASRRGR